MKFKNLEDKCIYYRGLTDYKLMPNSYTIVMVDGHKFSSLIKNKFKKPFDDEFIGMMNEVAKYLCEQIQGAKFAYTQSDEISLLITDFDTPMTDNFFKYRLCKMQSLIASMATAKFNQEYTKYKMKHMYYGNPEFVGVKDMEKEIPLCTFDCKVWTIPNANDAYAWFLFRQTDCIKNSKAQTAQAYCSHKSLLNLDADQMIAKTKDEFGIDWHEFPADRKFGRLIKKVETPMEKDIKRKDGTKEHIQFVRNIWTPTATTDFKVDNTMIKELIPNRD